MQYQEYEIRWKKHWFDFIINNDKDWNYEELLNNPNMDLNLVLNNLDKPWDFFWLSHLISKDDTFDRFDVIENNLSLEWNLYEIIKNKNISINIIRQYSKIPWDFEILTEIFDKKYGFDIILQNMC